MEQINIGDILPIVSGIKNKSPEYNKLFKYLVECGADLNISTNFPSDSSNYTISDHRYPLEIIILSTPVDFELLKLFVENGADVNRV